MKIENINADWLNEKISQHYKDKREFANDERNAFTYSMISKHTIGSQKMTARYKNHYYLFFLTLDNALI